MSKERNIPYRMNSISELHRILELPKPKHPLVSVINFETIKCYSEERLTSVVYNFYSIALKKGFTGKMKYGRNYYDFEEGVMTFFAPGQVVSTDISEPMTLSGWWLVIHPDFIQNYPLAMSIKTYGYFSYAVHEALHLSEKEESTISSLILHMEQEHSARLDAYSQNVMVSQIDLLLQYCNRFYNRQFITRKHINHDLLQKMEMLLTDYFNSDKVKQMGLPSVSYLADQLSVSPNYLSDMLRSLTGQNAQQHIHHYLIEKAKNLLTNTSLSVSEISYQLGFEFPQSFHKLFKSKTQIAPLEFRASFI